MAHDQSGIRSITPRRRAYNRVFDSTEPTARLGGTQGTRHPVLQKPSSPRPQGLRCPEAEPATSNGRGLFLWARGDGPARYSAALRFSHGGNRNGSPRPLWVADIPQKAGSTRPISSFPIRACASSIPSPLGRYRHPVTGRRGGCRLLRACRACTPRRRQHGVDCFVRWGSIDRQATGTSASGPSAPPRGLQCAAWAERGMP